MEISNVQEKKKAWEIAPSTYEQLTPKAYRKHSTLIWCCIMVLLNIPPIAFQALFGTVRSLLTMIFLALIGILLPPVTPWVRKRWLNLDSPLATFVTAPTSEVASWLQDTSRRVVTGNWLKWLCGIVNVILGILTIYYLGRRTGDFNPSSLSLIAFFPLLFFCGTAAYTFVYGLVAIARLARLPIRVSLYQGSHTGMSTFNQFILRFLLICLLFYSLLCGAILTSPFKVSIVLLGWLSMIGSWVALLLPITLYGLHNAMVNAKRNALVKLEPHLDKAINESIEQPTKDKLEFLQSLFDLKNHIQGLPEWPIDFKTVFTLMTTVLIPVLALILQVIMSK